MSYKKHNLEIIASDYNSSLFRHNIFLSGIVKQAKLLDIPQIPFGIISKKGQIEYAADLGVWTQAHEILKERALSNENYVDKLIDQSIHHADQSVKWSDKNIFQVNLTKVNNQKLVSLLWGFIDYQSASYAYGVVLPLLDFQGFSFVEGNLEKFLKSKLAGNKFTEAYSIFTQPSENSFAQDQEEALLKLIEKFYQDKKWRQDVLEGDLDSLKKAYPKFYKALSSHAKKFGWVYYVYSGPAFDENNFLEFIRDYVYKKIDPSKKIDQFKKNKKDIQSKQLSYIKELKPDSFNQKILKLAGKVVWGKPRRKDLQSQAYYHAEKLLKEIAQRLYVSLSQIRSTPIEMIEKALMQDKPIDLDYINSIFKFHACFTNDNGLITTLTDKEAQNFIDKKVAREIQDSLDSISQIEGDVAYIGKAKGIVKIVNSPVDIGKMEYGDILVSKATTPSVVPAMKKAAAIVTDEGGLTCHASIVSRELGIPCVVGTKIATKVFKDGDMVEVDATKGIIRKI